jgi:uncharacterized delta-60 repeat protein
MKKLILASILALLSFPSVAQPFAPDSTFGTNGRLLYTVFGNTVERNFGVLAQPDNKIVVAGLAKNQSTGFFELCISRYNPTGIIDNTFGVNGVRKVSLGNQGSIGGQTPKMKFDPEGRIVACNTGYTPGGSQDVFVCRLDTSGNLDNTFNGTGSLFIDMTGTSTWPDIANALDVDAAGNIWLCGATRNGGSPLDNNFAVVKVRSDGTLDPSFDQDGKKLYNPGGSSEFGRGIVVQQDGKVVVGGITGGNMYVFRIDTTGVIDPSFNNVGYRTIAIGSGCEMFDMIIDSQQRIIVGGQASSSAAALARILPNGTLDTSFNTTGTFNQSIGNSIGNCTDIALLAGDKILLGGSSNRVGTGDDFYAAIVTEAGKLDTSFNGTGFCINPVANGSVKDVCNGVAMLSDGRIILAGIAEFSSAVNEDMALLMLKPLPVTTGVQQIESAVFGNFYPNPTNSALNFVCRNAQSLVLINAEGRIINHITTVAGLNTISVAEYAKGIYFLKDVNSDAALKFIKE